jgi:hypothetical protein
MSFKMVQSINAGAVTEPTHPNFVVSSWNACGAGNRRARPCWLTCGGVQPNAYRHPRNESRSKRIAHIHRDTGLRACTPSRGGHKNILLLGFLAN